MEEIPERRKQLRKSLSPPFLGALCLAETDKVAAFEQHFPLFIDLLNLSNAGALVKAPRGVKIRPPLVLIYKEAAKLEWKSFPVRALWSEAVSGDKLLIGLEFLDASRMDANGNNYLPSPASIGFLTEILFMDLVPRHAFTDLLNCFRKDNFSTGDRIVRQGEPGECLYILEHGACAVRIEKEGQVLTVDHIQRGEIFGEMAIITGEPRSAHVDAESDVGCWKLPKKDFENVAAECPDIRSFLTELVASRFDTCSHTADRTIGKYVIKSKIGKGGWSIVYRGLHETLGFPVAIKMMRHDMAENAEFVDRFRKEAKLISNMNHRNIINVYDIEERHRTIFIIMEYLDGSSLENLLKQRGRIQLARAVNYVVQTCRGLEYAHQRGIIHQDIKPANLFILPNDRVKILDFGLACPAGSEDLCFLGTAEYTAPEQVLGKAVGPYTDLYSLGFTAFEMVTGSLPFHGEDVSALVDRHVSEEIPDPADLIPDLPETFRKFIIKCTRRSLDERYKGVGEALKDLLPFARAIGCPLDDEYHSQRKMTTLLLSYSEDRGLELKRSLEKFSLELEALGVSVRSADFDNF